VHYEATDPAGRESRQRCADALPMRLVVVVADPGLEQIAEDVKCVGGAGAIAEKLNKLISGSRLGRIEMQIGDEQRGKSPDRR
jgi:hypothetical protein